MMRISKIVKVAVNILLASVLMTGCVPSAPKPVSKEELNKNKNTRVYIDETESDLKAQVYVKKYIEIINDGFKTKFFYEMDDCVINKTSEVKLNFYKDFVAVYNPGNVSFCKKAKRLADGFKITAKQISKNKIEIETDGTLGDIVAKHVALQSMPLDKEVVSELVALGHTSFNVDTNALSEKRLILDLYPEHLKIKSVYADGLAKRGYTIVDNYNDADKVVYIENLAGLPLNFAGGLKNFYGNHNTYSDYLAKRMKNMKDGLGNVGADSYSAYLSRQNLTKMASLNITNAGVMDSAHIAMLGVDLIGNMLFSDRDKYKTYAAYKLVIENKNHNTKKDKKTEKYKYRTAIYHFDVLSSASLELFKKEVRTSTKYTKNIKEDLVNYFENDKVSYPNNLRKADYEEINQ